MSRRLERRALAALSASPGRLAGAIPYGAWSADLGGWRERIAPGAFDRSLAEPDRILALWDHDGRQVLGRVGSGTLRLASDARALRFEVDLPDTSSARDLAVLVERGDISGASFAFRVRAGGQVWNLDAQPPSRTLVDVELAEITVAAMPAYPATSVSLVPA